MFKDFFLLSLSNLRQRGLRSWLTMIGIFIGIAAVVALISLGQGMKEAIAGQFAGLGADTITVQSAGGGFGPPGAYAAALITRKDLDNLKRVRGVSEGFGRLIESVAVEVDSRQDYGYLVSLPQRQQELDLAKTIPFSLEIVSGRMLTIQDCSKVVIGNDLSTKDVLVRKLKINDKITIGKKTFDIVGILKKSGNPQMDVALFAPESCAREVTDQKEKYGVLLALVGKGEDVPTVVERIEKDFRKSRNVDLGKEDFVVQSSQEVLDSLNTVLGVVQAVLIGIAAISLLVGGIGIMNTMYTAVLERTREIGIMKAIGGRNRDVLLLFLLESGLLGTAGGLIGVSLGVGLALGVQQVANIVWGTSLIEANISFQLIIGALAFSFIVGTLSGTFPAMRASKMNPVEALSYG